MNNDRGTKAALGWLLAVLPLIAVAALVALLAWLYRAPRAESRLKRGQPGWPRVLTERLADGTAGRRLVLPAPPQRICSVTLGTDEILLDLVDPSRIVALTYLAPKKDSNIRDRVAGIRHFVTEDVESIIALRPDLCFVAGFTRKETQNLLAEARIPVFTFHRFNGLEDIYENIRTVGYAVGEDSRAEAVVADMRRRLDLVARRLPEGGRRPALLSYGPSGWVSGRHTTYTELIEAAGARNAAAEAGIDLYRQVSVELVVRMDPDYFLIVEGDIGMGNNREWLAKHPVLSSLKAVRDQRFIRVQDRHLSSVSRYAVDAVEAMARQLYPDRFQDDSTTR